MHHKKILEKTFLVIVFFIYLQYQNDINFNN